MKYIISGTNRPGARSLQLAKFLQALYVQRGEPIEIIDLRTLPLQQVDGSQYTDKQPAALIEVLDKLAEADGIVFVVPEYNGSMPGILKYFVDHWRYPETFEFRPFCFVGLGGAFGGLRAVEHLQQVMGYRNGFIYPERIFLQGVFNLLDAQGQIKDEKYLGLLNSQVNGFITFTKTLKDSGLHALSRKKV